MAKIILRKKGESLGMFALYFVIIMLFWVFFGNKFIAEWSNRAIVEQNITGFSAFVFSSINIILWFVLIIGAFVVFTIGGRS